eukprot:CAMPEP_0168327210 /NCGR_PEP_ID=MMETSP0213-20121227/5769_1 /TAXON_ID=151035 /ORGANISM="Euplotes harpa, Strain FSP1.4" /LENGTH=252 /DNA_ID=CAMNT_0008330085 /DNA_START=726 /DNA_END=1484 /DNA_ORIENTATION=+
MSISFMADLRYWTLIYFRPWCRIAAYEVGVIFGMFYYEWMNRDKSVLFGNSYGCRFFQLVYHSKVVRYPFYIVGFIIINVLIILQHAEGQSFPNAEQHFGQLFHDFYNAFARPLFVFSLMLILSGPLTGRSKLLKFILGSNGYSPWAKVSFMAYLIHLLVFAYYYDQIRESVYPDNKSIIITMAACMLLAFMISVPFSALFEAPFLQLERLVLFPVKPKKNKEESLYMQKYNKDIINSSLADTTYEKKSELS